jgi:hypothetical protein
MENNENSPAISAIHKFEEFYKNLPKEERKVIGLIVSSSVQRAARAEAEQEWFREGKSLLELLTPTHAPTLISELGTYVAGQAAPMNVDKNSF